PNNIVHKGIFASPALGDLDGDGVLDIVIAAMDQHVYAWKGNGSPVRGWPVLARDLSQPAPKGARIVSSTALGDLDRDGMLDVVAGPKGVRGWGGGGSAFRSDGPLCSGGRVGVPSITPSGSAPSLLPLVGEGVPASPSLADVDGVGTLEVAITAIAGLGYLYK